MHIFVERKQRSASSLLVHEDVGTCDSRVDTEAGIEGCHCVGEHAVVDPIRTSYPSACSPRKDKM